jgi:hypothetical protein
MNWSCGVWPYRGLYRCFEKSYSNRAKTRWPKRPPDGRVGRGAMRAVRPHRTSDLRLKLGDITGRHRDLIRRACSSSAKRDCTGRSVAATRAPTPMRSARGSKPGLPGAARDPVASAPCDVSASLICPRSSAGTKSSQQGFVGNPAAKSCSQP